MIHWAGALWGDQGNLVNTPHMPFASANPHSSLATQLVPGQRHILRIWIDTAYPPLLGCHMNQGLPVSRWCSGVPLLVHRKTLEQRNTKIAAPHFLSVCSFSSPGSRMKSPVSDAMAGRRPGCFQCYCRNIIPSGCNGQGWIPKMWCEAMPTAGRGTERPNF